MRLSLGSVGVLTAALLTALAFWPEGRVIRGPERLAAQEKSLQDGEAESLAKERRSTAVFRLAHEHPLSSDVGQHPQVESALDETVNFKIEPQPLKDALDLLAAKFRVPILIDDKALNDANVDTSMEVQLNVPGATLHHTLGLLLKIPAAPLTFEVLQNGTLMVSTVDMVNDHLQVVVYDCRDLATLNTLDHFPVQKSPQAPAKGGGAVGGGGGMFQAPAEAAKPAVAAQSVPQKQAAPGIRPPQPPPPNAPAPAQGRPSESAKRLPLIQTIIAATGPDAWGESQTISELGGLIVVCQNSTVHEKIKALLADIRRMRASGAFASSAKDYDAEVQKRLAAEATVSGDALKTKHATPRPVASPATAK
jgi:hypothetical protein